MSGILLSNVKLNSTLIKFGCRLKIGICRVLSYIMGGLDYCLHEDVISFLGTVSARFIPENIP